MRGYRAFGRNEGGLGHAGDFMWLFGAIGDRLSTMAVYHQNPLEGLTFPFLWKMEDSDEAERKEEEVVANLKSLEMVRPPRPKSSIDYPAYYRPGFFPEFGQYLVDDWNDLVCFAEPFPEYETIVTAEFGVPDIESFRDDGRSPKACRQAWMETGFRFYFRNIDACWWEVFSPDDEALSKLVDYWSASKIGFQELEFERDFPSSTRPVERDF